jgi:hypothetical protein
MPTAGQIAAGVGAAAVIGLGVLGVAIAGDDGSPQTLAAEPAPVFQATFNTPGDFYDRFDYGFSGLFLPGHPNVITTYHGDHDMACQGPTTFRDIVLSGPGGTGAMDFSQAFWHCAPGNDPSKGHVMTGITTTGYNHVWFSPKPEFTGITKVCYDINETFMGEGKWTELQFINHADAVRYPTGTITVGGAGVARGSGGFDLGYTAPEFQPPSSPNNGIVSPGNDTAGLRVNIGSIFGWWQNGAYVAQGVGWPGLLPGNNGGPVTDKAVRYTTCVENVGTSQIKITNNRPNGPAEFTINNAHIPQDARRVVFHDAEYNGPKRAGYDPNVLTWHWDNVQVFTVDSPPVTTVLPPSTTQLPTTTAPEPTTTSTTLPTTTTSSTTSTTTSSTTTVPGSSTTSPFVTVPRDQLEALLAAIEELAATIQALLDQ